MPKNEKELTLELNSFNNIWDGGYRTGYHPKRNQKSLEGYLNNIVKQEQTVFEIGCGGGQWTNLLSKLSNKVYCNDAKDAETNRLFEYLRINNFRNNVEFFQAKNFKLDYLEDDSIDFVFSYDVFCHISLTGQRLYLENLYQKCKRGAILMIMYADPRKYIQNEPENLNIAFGSYISDSNNIDKEDICKQAIQDADGESSAGRWYWIGKDNFIKSCIEFNYSIVEADLNIDKTNPITVFTKL